MEFDFFGISFVCLCSLSECERRHINKFNDNSTWSLHVFSYRVFVINKHSNLFQGRQSVTFKIQVITIISDATMDEKETQRHTDMWARRVKWDASRVTWEDRDLINKIKTRHDTSSTRAVNEWISVENEYFFFGKRRSLFLDSRFHRDSRFFEMSIRYIRSPQRSSR